MAKARGSMELNLKVFMIPFDSLKLQKQIGEGSFGRVRALPFPFLYPSCPSCLSTLAGSEGDLPCSWVGAESHFGVPSRVQQRGQPARLCL